MYACVHSFMDTPLTQHLLGVRIPHGIQQLASGLGLHTGQVICMFEFLWMFVTVPISQEPTEALWKAQRTLQGPVSKPFWGLPLNRGPQAG